MSLATMLKSKGSFKLDLSANLAGMGWYALVQFVCIPFYIKFLGVEGYGLIGFYVMLQTMLQVLDLGLTPTINRELARHSVRPELAGEARDLVRTMEAGYWVVGALIGTMIMAVAPLIAGHWIQAAGIPAERVRQAVVAMGVLFVFQWPVAFYQAGLIGLHRQVLANAIKIGGATLSGGGALIVLWLVSPTARAFFLWQATVAAVQSAVLLVCLWHTMPAADRKPRLNFKLLRGVSRFAAGMSGITVSAVILTQLDKLILSRICSLEVFGYYTLAGMFGRGLMMLGVPVFDTIFPRFSALAAAHDERTMDQLYHRASQVMAVLVVPLATVLALFSSDILLLWTRSPEIARNAATIACVLTVGTAINTLMFLPYALQLAHGWVSIGLKMNLGLIILLVSTIWILATRYGGIGAASAYLVLMCLYMAMGVPLTHRRLLKGATTGWFLRDIGLPAAAVLLVGGLGRAFYNHAATPLVAAVSLGLVFVATIMAAAFAAPQVRAWLVAALSKIRPAYV